MNTVEVALQNSCPLCRSENLKPLRSERNRLGDHSSPLVRSFDGTWIQLLSCRDCSFAFTKELPPDQFFAERYDIRFDPEFESKNTFKDRILDGIFRDLARRGRTTGRFLDIGSFAGVFLSRARARGFEIEGIEVNPTVAEYTRKALGMNVRHGLFLEQTLKDQDYDVVTMIDVLEHLTRPRMVLEKCAKILKPGGQIVIKVPNYPAQLVKQVVANMTGVNDMGIFENFGHINHFSPRSLRNILESLGFENVKVVVSRSEYFPVDRFKNRLKNWARDAFYYVSLALSKLTGLCFGLNIIVIADKKR